ncbi:DNA topoisomerase III [Desulfobacter hydrogenophilus]|uniref:DNA topoisomerase n=1 Tax=Desulfobacter hydrogenophilus TaxID=2291 RepID=A0A328FJU9_9BACT|nr:DNA topoisomerase 3 [Desulfobacter hydrogenophilus]NDY71826.1 DNA topoisomerase III [Desulfobacter hydrogenophilus]QBH13522.1 DNA topoisomerase III [Desulfobacter hydrogenophilus]RAM03772.1 DNA topoisomerase III [Desulfobacter hydrogenophilus]
MRLFIAEKPSLGRAIAAGLGDAEKRNGYIECGQNVVTWCFGHLLEMDKPEEYDEKYRTWKKEDLPILPNSFNASVRKESAAQLKIIGKLLQDAERVVNAGDPDREGQLLVDEVLEYHNYAGSCERIWLAALDDKSVKKALSSMTDNNDYIGLRDAARARSQADWLVGINCTRAMTLIGRDAGSHGVLSLGRVQTPTLALVVNRDLVIENFKPHPYFTLHVEILHETGRFTGTFQPLDTQKGLDDQGRLINPDEAFRIKKEVSGQTGKVIESVTEKKKKNPPLPHCLSSLQKAASSKLGMGAKQVLDAAQALYEKKLTTYPRSDCRYLPEEQFDEAGSVLAVLASLPGLEQVAENTDSSIKSAAYNTKKVTAHHAIIPTGETPSNLSGDESALYHMIAQSFCIQFYAAMEFEAQKILTGINNTVWKSTGRKILNPGWTAFIKEEKSDAEKAEKNEEQDLPIVHEGDGITAADVEIKSKKTKPPARFTEGMLIEAMANIHRFIENTDAKKTLKENEGIGTEATRAGIIETLKARHLLALQKKNITSTDLGRQLVKMAPEVLTDPVTTAQWESRLSAIADGKESLSGFMTDQTIQVPELIKAIFALQLDPLPGTHLCPECGQPLRRQKSKKGSWYWGCFNQQGHAKPVFLNDKNGKPDLTPKKKIEVSKHKCQACGKPLVKRESKKKGKGGKKNYWWGCSGFPECRQTYFDDNGKPQFKDKKGE